MPKGHPEILPDGTCRYGLSNNVGQQAEIRLEASLTPRLILQSAGNGILIVAADGVTALLTIPETGGIVQSSLLVPTVAGPPAGGQPAQIYIDSNNSNVLTYFDGTTASPIGLLQ